MLNSNKFSKKSAQHSKKKDRRVRHAYEGMAIQSEGASFLSMLLAFTLMLRPVSIGGRPAYSAIGLTKMHPDPSKTHREIMLVSVSNKLNF